MDSSADKEGLQSSGRKEESSRHGVEPSPATSPVPGASGHEGELADEELEDIELVSDDDDLELDPDDDVTEDEAERADGA